MIPRTWLQLFTTLAILATLTPPLHADPLDNRIPGAVDRGLDFLARQQLVSGPNAGAFRATEASSTAVTSLSVMAFLARGHTPGQGQYGEHLNRAIDYVLDRQQPNGLLSTSEFVPMYDHGISTVMLCEAFGMLDDTRQKKASEVISKAVRLILDAQKIPKAGDSAGGWRYSPEASDADISVSGWQLMALRGVANVGADVPKQSIDDAVAYMARRWTGGGFSYTGDTGDSTTRTGIGVTSLCLLGKYDSRQALAGGDYLLRNPIRTTHRDAFFYYGVYYVAQAAYQLGGKYQAGIYTPLKNTLLDLQQPNGSWKATQAESQFGDTYPTAMSILALCVPYRYLPLYQR